MPVRCAVGLSALAAGVLAASRLDGLPFSDAAMLACTALAAAGFFRAGVTHTLPRSALLLGWSATTWLAGVAAWLTAESQSGSGLGALSGGLMIAGSALLLAGLLRLSVAPTALGAKLRLAMEGLLVAASILFVAWEPVVEPCLAGMHHGPVVLSPRSRSRSPTWSA